MTTTIETIIDQRRAEIGDPSYREIAEAAGLTTQTLLNIRQAATQPRPTTLRKLDRALRWPPDTLLSHLQNTQPPENNTPATSVSGQIRTIKEKHTDHGHLTWIEHSDETRDYTLTRDIAGQERAVSVNRSTLNPAEAVEDLTLGLDLFEQMVPNSNREA